MIAQPRFLVLFNWLTMITINSYSSEIIDPQEGKLDAVFTKFLEPILNKSYE